MLVAVKKYSFNENTVAKVGAVYAILKLPRVPPVPTDVTVSTILFVPPKLAPAMVMVLPTT